MGYGPIAWQDLRPTPERIAWCERLNATPEGRAILIASIGSFLGGDTKIWLLRSPGFEYGEIFSARDIYHFSRGMAVAEILHEIRRTDARFTWIIYLEDVGIVRRYCKSFGRTCKVTITQDPKVRPWANVSIGRRPGTHPPRPRSRKAPKAT